MKEPATEIVLLDPERVKPFKDQPRKRFRGIANLAESIRLVGQITPIVVTPCDGFERSLGFDAELINGERRLQACRALKRPVKAVVEGPVSAADRFALSVAANFCRQAHDCMESAAAVAKLKLQGRTSAEIAGIFGKTISWVAQHYSLMSLHPEVQRMLERAADDLRQTGRIRRRCGRMTFSLALLLVPLESARQVRLAKVIVQRKMSLAAARDYVRKAASAEGTKHGHTGVGKTISPRGRFSALYNLFDTFGHGLNRYVDMPYAELAAVAGSVDARQRAVLVQRMEQTAADLAGVRKVFAKAGDK